MSIQHQRLIQAYQEGARLGVLGDPVRHSLSPAMHNAALNALNLPYQYTAIHVTAEELPEAISILRDLGFFGWNLTIPHKVAALDLVDHIDPIAEKLGAINTMINRSGRLFGLNTDGPGLVEALRESLGPDWADRPIAVIGAGGGAGQAAVRYLSMIGLDRLVVANRTRSKVERLKLELADHTNISIVDWEQLDLLFQQNHLIINATSLGLAGEELDWPLDWLRADHCIFDMVYGEAQTPLVRWARKKEVRAYDGRSMLLHQGILAFETWFGKPAPEEVMRQALLNQKPEVRS
jgi:shikimate dehydrogenase